MEATSISEESVKKATGRSWAEWFDFLNNIHAENLPHKTIAATLQKQKEVSAWWAQSITVEYERKIGRREVGQNCEGNFSASASKTLPGTMDQVFNYWKEFVKEVDHFNQVPFSNAPQTSETDKWRYWRISLEDGSRLTIMVNQKTPDKAQLAVNHEKLSESKAVDRWKAFWKSYLQKFQEWMG